MVYKHEGMIIATSNIPRSDLKELLGDPIYRRLSGENDKPEDFAVWDFWKLAKKGKDKVRRVAGLSGQVPSPRLA